MRKTWRTAIAAIWLAAAAPGQSADMDDLEWIAGEWLTEGGADGGEWSEERWAPARGGVMLGTSLSGRGDKSVSYEFMRIEMDAEGQITLWGSPQGAPPVPFRLLSCDGAEAIFENPLHDFPTRIVYRKTASGLQATVSGPNGASPQTWQFERIAKGMLPRTFAAVKPLSDRR